MAQNSRERELPFRAGSRFQPRRIPSNCLRTPVISVLFKSFLEELSDHDSVSLRVSANHVEMAQTSGQQTYRVRQVPAHCSHFHDLARLLAHVLEYRKTITVRSLASSIDSFESPPTKVATVIFEDRPHTLYDEQNHERSEWLVGKTIFSHSLIIDTHFRGFTPLNEVDVDHHLVEFANHTLGLQTS